jgi:hypothetical protein
MPRENIGDREGHPGALPALIIGVGGARLPVGHDEVRGCSISPSARSVEAGRETTQY